MNPSTRIALFGDSYIEHLGRFCDGDLKIPCMVGFFGKGGMTVNRYDTTRYNAMTEFRPDVVFLNLGGNDIRSNSDPKTIASEVLALVDKMKKDGVKIVYCAELCKFPKDKNLTKKCFNAQRKKINKIIKKSGAVQFVTFSMRFPKDYSSDKIHFSKPQDAPNALMMLHENSTAKTDR